MIASKQKNCDGEFHLVYLKQLGGTNSVLRFCIERNASDVQLFK